MKKSVRILSVVMILVMGVLMLASCAKTISGTYEAEIQGLLSKYTATYEFSGSKVEATKKVTNILGQVETTTFSGTYEITENDDGSMEITFDFDGDDGDIKDGTFTFEEGEDYIKIGLVKYNKK